MNATYSGQPQHAGFPSPRSWYRADEVTLAAVKTAQSSVFCFVHIVVQNWGLLHLLPDAERVAVELVARAVETTGIPDDEPRWTEIDELPTIGVRVSVKHDVLLIEVRDCDCASPVPVQGTYLDQHLMAVHDLSRGWNWYPVDGGKVVWAELVPRHAQPPRILPQRSAGSFFFPEPETPVVPFQDMALTQRVLDGLRRHGVAGETR